LLPITRDAPGIMKCSEGVEPLSCQIPEPISPVSQVPHLG
jgi:hypothetical protein